MSSGCNKRMIHACYFKSKRFRIYSHKRKSFSTNSVKNNEIKSHKNDIDTSLKQTNINRNETEVSRFFILPNKKLILIFDKIVQTKIGGR